jgi:hypothetical protein
MGEAEAARLFVYTMMRQVRESWPGVLSELKKLDSSESALARLDEEPAQWELVLAAMALDLGAMKNLFPEEQAHRLLERCIEYFPEDTRNYARNAVEEYNSRYDEDATRGLNPAPAMGEILYGRWGLAGEDYVPAELFIASDQILAGALAVVISSYLGVWKRIRTNFVVEGD